MPRTLTPPRGMFIPSDVIFNNDMPPVLRDTWIQLRALAWGQDETPPLTIKEIASITGKSEKTIYGHLSLLRSDDALRWHPSKRGTIIVEFRNCRFSGNDAVSKFSEVDNSENLELPVNVIVLNNKESLNDIDDDSFKGGDNSEISENNSEFSENHSEKTEISKISEIPTLRDAERLYCKVTGFVTVPMGIVPYLEKILDLIQALGGSETENRLTSAWAAWKNGKRRDNGKAYSRTNPAWIDFAITGETLPENKAQEESKYTSYSDILDIDFPGRNIVDVDPGRIEAMKEWNRMVSYARGYGYDQLISDLTPDGSADNMTIFECANKLQMKVREERARL